MANKLNLMMFLHLNSTFFLLLLLISFSSADDERGEIESVGRKFVSGVYYNTTLNIPGNAPPNGVTLRAFNSTPGSIVQTKLHIISATGPQGVLFKVNASIHMEAYLRGGDWWSIRYIHEAGSLEYYGISGCGNCIIDTPTTLSLQSGPLRPTFLRHAFTGITPSFRFSSNVSVTVQAEMEYNLFDTRIANNTKTSIPAFDNADYFTYENTNKNESYNLTLILESTNPNVTISSRLSSFSFYLDSRNQTFDLTSVNIGSWTITLVDLQGPAILELKNKRVLSQDINLTISEYDNEQPIDGDGDGDGGGDGGGSGDGSGGDDDSDALLLSTGHIILISIGGAIFVVFAVGVIVGLAAVVIRRRQRGYVTLGIDP